MVERLTYSVLLVNCGLACTNGPLFHRAANNATTIVSRREATPDGSRGPLCRRPPPVPDLGLVDAVLVGVC